MTEKSKFFVMIVDKDAAIRNKLGKRLAEEGYSIETSVSAEAALKKFDQEGELPHVIFCEVSMGGMSGVQFLSKVKKMNEDVEVIMMASYTTAESAIESVRLGAYDYINKDEFDDINMVAAVCNRAVEKIKIRFQNIYLINQMKEQNIQMEKKAKEIERKKDQLDKLNRSIMRSQLEGEQRLRLSNTLFPLTDPKEVMQSACDLLVSFHDQAYYLVLLIDKDSKSLTGFASGPKGYLNVEDLKIDLAIAMDPKKMGFFLDNISTYPEFVELIFNNYKTNNFVTYTLSFKKTTPFGLFVIIADQSINLTKLSGMQEFLMQITSAYESAVMHQKINDMAIKDGLTDLFNHRHFMDELEKEIKKAIRYKYPMSLLFFDIDHFKSFNDQNGHQVGDEVLVKVSQLLKNNTRVMDIVGFKKREDAESKGQEINNGYDKTELFASRYGGEEFAVILPHTDITGAHIAGERFREAVEKADFPCQEKQPLGTLTISMGVAEVSEQIITAKSLILVADAALYTAKKNGRNQVCIADDKLVDLVLKQGKLNL